MKILLPLLLASLITAAGCAPMGRNPGEARGTPPERAAGSLAQATEQQERLHKTADALNLTPTQHVLWASYQEKAAALMADMMRPAPIRARQTALQQIDQKVDAVRRRLTAMEDIQETAAQLYERLDDTQKKIADQLLPATMPTLYATQMPPAGSERPAEQGGLPGTRSGMGGGFGRNGSQANRTGF